MIRRNKCILWLLMISFMLALTSCGGGYREEVSQPEEVSYFHFTGNVKNVEVSIDGKPFFKIRRKGNNGGEMHYQVAPGKHEIIAKRVLPRKADVVLVKRILIIGEGMAKEVRIP